MKLLQAAATVESGENASSSGCHLFMSFRLEQYECPFSIWWMFFLDQLGCHDHQ